MSAPLPKTLGRYEIQSELGRGMMGVVYQAKDPTLGRIVALKTINVAFAMSESERSVFEQRFMNEARLAAGLSHPNIVVVHDVGWDEATRTPYIALEFLQGTLLSELVPPPVDWREALRITGRLAEALHVAHVQKIVHRDIKPANVMLLPNKEPKLMDFGIARAPTSNLTAAGEFFGTPSYMSPEQALGEPLDGRSDLFSLGAVLYLLLTAQRAFEGKSVPAILGKVERENPAAPSSLVATIPTTVDDVVQRMLEKKPEHRYQDGLQLAEDIDDVLHEKPPRHTAPQATLHGDPTLHASLRRPPPAAARPGVETTVLKLLEGPRGLLVLGGVLVAALLVSLLLPERDTSPPPVASPSPFAPLASPGPSVSPSVRTPAPSTLGSPPATGSPTPSAIPSPLPAASTAAAASKEAPPEAVASRSARLTVAVEHNVKDGKLRVLVNQKLVLEKPLAAKETKKALIFKGRKGEFFQVIDLAPGEHTIRIEVEDGGATKAAQIAGVFKRGEARLLEVKAGGRVELEWR